MNSPAMCRYYAEFATKTSISSYPYPTFGQPMIRGHMGAEP